VIVRQLNRASVGVAVPADRASVGAACKTGEVMWP
jgi:hypothetical protein